MEKILVSSCLLGEKVRYDGNGAKVDNPILKQWTTQGRVVPLCPEINGGLTVPRSPAEIIGSNGFAVLDGFAAVLDALGNDVTQPLVEGANTVLEIAQSLRIKIAILKDGSPSCGRTYIHNGQFRGSKKRGEVGVTSALLQRNGIAVFSEFQIAEAERRLAELESAAK